MKYKAEWVQHMETNIWGLLIWLHVDRLWELIFTVLKCLVPVLSIPRVWDTGWLSSNDLVLPECWSYPEQPGLWDRNLMVLWSSAG